MGSGTLTGYEYQSQTVHSFVISTTRPALFSQYLVTHLFPHLKHFIFSPHARSRDSRAIRQHLPHFMDREFVDTRDPQFTHILEKDFIVASPYVSIILYVIHHHQETVP